MKYILITALLFSSMSVQSSVDKLTSCDDGYDELSRIDDWARNLQQDANKSMLKVYHGISKSDRLNNYDRHHFYFDAVKKFETSMIAYTRNHKESLHNVLIFLNKNCNSYTKSKHDGYDEKKKIIEKMIEDLTTFRNNDFQYE